MASEPAHADDEQALAVERPQDAVEPSDWMSKPQGLTFVVSVPTKLGKRILSAQERQFIDAYLGKAGEVPAEAARLAGYSNGSAIGSTLLRRLRQAIEQERTQRWNSLFMGPEELIAQISWYARNGKIVGRGVSIKSQDTLARIHGLLQDKLQLSFDRPALLADLRACLTELRKAPIEAEVIEARTLPNAPDPEADLT